jgi:hypothetical protein
MFKKNTTLNFDPKIICGTIPVKGSNSCDPVVFQSRTNIWEPMRLVEMNQEIWIYLEISVIFCDGQCFGKLHGDMVQYYYRIGFNELWKIFMAFIGQKQMVEMTEIARATSSWLKGLAKT